MFIISNIALFSVLFFLIGKAADLVIRNIKILGINLGIKQFWLGLILGILTSTPEFALGLEALTKNMAQLSFGNLVGGTVVLLGLILGITVVLDKGIDVSISLTPLELIIMAIYISLPLWLMMDGSLTTWDGLLLIITYAICVFYFIHSKSVSHATVKLEKATSNVQALGFSFLGLLGVVVIAKFIIDVSLPLVNMWNIPPFFAGLVFFSIGTNLPELTLALRSWKDGDRDLSFGNLMGSAFANPLIIGLFVFIRPIFQIIDESYYLFMFCMLALLIVLVALSYTGRRLTAREGWVLICFYLLFLVAEVSLRWL